jgi:hypothetical protein
LPAAASFSGGDLMPSHIADIQERVRQLRNGMPKLDKMRTDENLSILARQHQSGGVQFPSITERAGQEFAWSN